MSTGGGGYAAASPNGGSGGGSNELVLEVFSNSTQAWMVGIICNTADGIVTVRFLDAQGQKRQKAAYRQDPMFAQFGTHSGDKLPPGCVKVPSQTRPGQFSYFDQAAGRKFATPELAWHAFLEQKLIIEEKDKDKTDPKAKQDKTPGGAEITPAQTLLQPPGQAGRGATSPADKGVTSPESTRRASSGDQLSQWLTSYVHQPVLATPGINYLNQVPINFDRCTELFAQEVAANAPHRPRMVSIIESGAFMKSSFEVFKRLDSQGNNYLLWANGAIRDYVIAVFQGCGLAAPKETAISKMYTAFDVKQQGGLGGPECLVLADAIARTIFRADAHQPGVSNETVQHPSASSSESPAPQQAPLGTQAAASPFLQLLAGLGRQEQGHQDGSVRPFVYSTFADHGRKTPATEVRGFGLVEGSAALARILCQRSPTSVLNGGPHAEEVRQRLQAQAAAMIAQQQAQAQAAGMVTVPHQMGHPGSYVTGV